MQNKKSRYVRNSLERMKEWVNLKKLTYCFLAFALLIWYKAISVSKKHESRLITLRRVSWPAIRGVIFVLTYIKLNFSISLLQTQSFPLHPVTRKM
jgi:hypothetical protein